MAQSLHKAMAGNGNALIHVVITAVFHFLKTLVTTGNLHAALVAGAAAGVADFLRELG